MGEREPRLTKSEAVLERTAVLRHLVSFRVPREDQQDDSPWVEVSREQWQDMGSPDQITVTIQPGDRLNDDE